MKYTVNTINKRKAFADLESATAYFNQMIESGATYVELAKIVSESPIYRTESVKIHMR